jgi:hypothetical protein
VGLRWAAFCWRTDSPHARDDAWVERVQSGSNRQKQQRNGHQPMGNAPNLRQQHSSPHGSRTESVQRTGRPVHGGGVQKRAGKAELLGFEDDSA